MLRNDGTLWCWGHGYLGDGSSGETATETPVQVAALGNRVVQVSAGFGHTCARTSDDVLWCWGPNDQGQIGADESVFGSSTPLEVTALGAGVADVQASGNTTCAILRSGALYCWGEIFAGIFGEGGPTGRVFAPTPVPDSLECGEPLLY